MVFDGEKAEALTRDFNLQKLTCFAHVSKLCHRLHKDHVTVHTALHHDSLACNEFIMLFPLSQENQCQIECCKEFTM